ncbi:hypothetical protein H1R17_05715 [Flavobacterium sp. xlx-214]|uniref:hypothetical protein n=1 Tax=unclassified Flavobacterium TaxID=196869 RepID=UPI0013D0E662|nr:MULTISPECIES: hypothetical protein [unclassified Flavobacterium]MBA5793052.1 hypothetical protein [Flavobacterium sp. xlx-221]QMI84620.1 hypothetical protein H1R17_05715 [Flavobacterium sp. xlx-214]
MYRIVNVVSVFLLLAIVFVPLPTSHLDFNVHITQFLFQDLVKFLSNFFKIKMIGVDFDSDSVSLAILLYVLFAISLVAFFFKKSEKFNHIVQIISGYYLIFVLLVYGFNKLFLEQFPEPESNILYTNFGMLQKDILYWSVLGLAPTYTFLIGFLECLTAFLLFFRKTRLFGLLLAFVSFSYIFIVNISFDISVKIFSFLLLLITVFQLYFYRDKLKKLSYVLFEKSAKQSKPIQLAAKSFVMLSFISVLLIPYFSSMEHNNIFSVAYELQTTTCNPKIAALNFKRMYVLKQGYVVFENAKEQMIDYKIVKFDEVLRLEKRQNITTFVVKYKDKNTIVLDNEGCSYTFKTISVEKLPVFTHKNHLFIDYVP